MPSCQQISYEGSANTSENCMPLVHEALRLRLYHCFLLMIAVCYLTSSLIHDYFCLTVLLNNLFPVIILVMM